MFSVRDIVIYGIDGVCQIIDITEKEVDGQCRQYYVLKPVYDENSTLYIPVHSEKTTAKMHRVLSPEEIYALIQAMPAENSIWIDSEVVRREKYKEIIVTGNRQELIRLIKTLYLHQQAKKENGKKLHTVDERFMKDAEKILYDEFAHVLAIKREQVLPFILEQIEAAEKNRARMDGC